MSAVEFSDADIERVRQVFGLDRAAAVARLEQGAARARRLADASRSDNPTTEES